jgi:hypothetical protein
MSEGRVRGRGRTPSRGFWRPYEAPAALYGLTECFPSAKKRPGKPTAVARRRVMNLRLA